MGLIPLDAGWWAQGLAAAAPWIVVFAMGGAVTLLLLALGLIHGDVRDALFSFAMGAEVAGVAFALGAALSFVPALSLGAGLIASALALTAIGLFFLLGGLNRGDRQSARLGLTLLGGFAAAAMIVVADLVARALT